MTITLERYTDKAGYNAEICMEKDSKLYTLIISKPMQDNPGFAIVVSKRDYMTINSARRSMHKQGEFIRE